MWLSRGLLFTILNVSLALGTIGCIGSSSSKSENGGGEGNGEGDGPSMTGTWNALADGIPITMKLTSDGNAFTGTYSDPVGGGTLTGSTSGNSVSMTLTGGGNVSQWSGSVNAERTSMSGTYKFVPDGISGTWTATKQ